MWHFALVPFTSIIIRLTIEFVYNKLILSFAGWKKNLITPRRCSAISTRTGTRRHWEVCTSTFSTISRSTTPGRLGPSAAKRWKTKSITFCSTDDRRGASTNFVTERIWRNSFPRSNGRCSPIMCRCLLKRFWLSRRNKMSSNVFLPFTSSMSCCRRQREGKVGRDFLPNCWANSFANLTEKERRSSLGNFVQKIVSIMKIFPFWQQMTRTSLSVLLLSLSADTHPKLISGLCLFESCVECSWNSLCSSLEIIVLAELYFGIKTRRFSSFAQWSRACQQDEDEDDDEDEDGGGGERRKLRSSETWIHAREKTRERRGKSDECKANVFFLLFLSSCQERKNKKEGGRESCRYFCMCVFLLCLLFTFFFSQLQNRRRRHHRRYYSPTAALTPVRIPRTTTT